MWHLQGERNTSQTSRTSLVDVSYLYGDSDSKMIYFLSFRHGIRNPDEHDIVLHPDANQVPMPCVLPEAD